MPVIELNHLSEIEHCTLSSINELSKIIGDNQFDDEHDTMQDLHAIDRKNMPEWPKFAPVNYLAHLDKSGVSICVRDQYHNDDYRGWAD